MAKNINMTEGKPLRLLLLFSLPLMLGNVFQQLYTVTDTAIVGQGVGMAALAAIGTVDYFNWLQFAVVQGFTQGFAVRMAMKAGEGDREGLKHTVAYSARLCIIITAITMIILFSALPTILKLLHVSDELYTYASTYTSILLAGLPAVVFYNLCASVLRSVGNSATPFRAMVVSSVTNIVLDLLAVFVLKMGIAGAAVATLISQVISGLICLRAMILDTSTHFSLKDMLKFDRELSQKLILLGLPMAAMNAIIACGGVIVQSVINNFGTSFIAGYAATNKLYGLLEIACISFGSAVSVYVGQNMGCGNILRIRKGVNAALILSIVASVVLAALLLPFGRDIIGLFINAETPELAKAAGDTAYTFLCVMSVMLPSLYLIFVYRNAIQGMGNTVMPMISGLVEFACRIIVAVIVSRLNKPEGIFAAEVSAWFGAMTLLCISYYIQLHKVEAQYRKKENLIHG